MLAEGATVASMLHEAFHALEGEEAALKGGVLMVVCTTTDSRCIYVHGKFLKLRRAVAKEGVTDDNTEWVSGNAAADDTLELCVPQAFVGATATREWPTAQAACEKWNLVVSNTNVIQFKLNKIGLILVQSSIEGST